MCVDRASKGRGGVCCTAWFLIGLDWSTGDVTLAGILKLSQNKRAGLNSATASFLWASFEKSESESLLIAKCINGRTGI